jgi:hypothetical protein
VAAGRGSDTGKDIEAVPPIRVTFIPRPTAAQLTHHRAPSVRVDGQRVDVVPQVPSISVVNLNASQLSDCYAGNGGGEGVAPRQHRRPDQRSGPRLS